MHLIIDNAEREIILIKDFRHAHALPENFGVALFEPKDFAGLGALEQAGHDMNDLRQGLLDLLPLSISKMDLLELVEGQQASIRAGLYSINDKIGLKPEEVEFAAAGFGDMLRTWVYALFAKKTDFKAIYHQWLSDSIRVSQDVHHYSHNGQN